MTDTRAKGQELQDQVLAAARKGQQRVASTVKNVTATAQIIRPQLPSMPRITNIKLPSAEHLAQIAEKQFSQLRDKAPGLIAKLPNADYLKAGAQEFAVQVRSVQHQVAGAQRQFVSQVRSAASPLAQQATVAWSQATAAGQRVAIGAAALRQNGTAAPIPARAKATTSGGPVATEGAETHARGEGGTKAQATAKPEPSAKARRASRKSQPAAKGAPTRRSSSAQAGSARTTSKKAKPETK